MTPKLQDLRRQLREQFPEAHQSQPPPADLPPATGLPAFPAGAISELSPAGPATGLSLVLAHLLEKSDVESEDDRDLPLALIDGHDSFDPASYGSASCARLLWVRCKHGGESLRCADLLLRDGNLPLVVLDLQLNPLPELRRIPASSWYRLRNLARRSGTTLLAFTPRPLIACAALRLSLQSRFSLTDLECARTELAITHSQQQRAARTS